MSLIRNEPIEELTKGQKLARAKNRIININTSIYNQMEKQHTLIFNIVWNNPVGLTPQEVLDQFGTDAAALFQFSSSIQTMLAQADTENYVPLNTPNEYVINSDGTVTIGALRV